VGVSGVALWQRGQIRLVWPAEHQMHGLEVLMRRRPIGPTIEEGLSGVEDRPWSELTAKERAIKAQENAADLAGLIVEWNFADEQGQPVPATVDGILTHVDNQMINDMWTAYGEGTSRVAPPLPDSSDGGSPTDEWDLPPQEPMTPSTS
jgi:hypothetical protein